jgi:hypothetical protein
MEISLKPTLSREQKPYRYHYTVSCEFPTFPDTIDNQLLPLYYFLKNRTATLHSGNKRSFTTIGQYLIAKIIHLFKTTKEFLDFLGMIHLFSFLCIVNPFVLAHGIFGVRSLF